MTIEEKTAQLGSVNADRVIEDGKVDREVAAELLEHGIGHLTRIGGEGGLSPGDAARVTNELQEILSETLGIPAIPHEECLSGYMGPEATTFPQMIGMASTWNPKLLQEVTDDPRRATGARDDPRALTGARRGTRPPVGARGGNVRRRSAARRSHGLRLRLWAAG